MTIPALKSCDDTSVFYANDNKSKADILNDIYVKATDIGDADSVFPDQLPRTEARLPDFLVTADDVSQAINSMACNKASGPDSNSAFILKRISDSLSPVLSRF